MVFPPDVGELGVGAAVAVGLLDVRLVRDAVEVFVEPVQEEGQQLLTTEVPERKRESARQTERETAGETANETASGRPSKRVSERDK